MQELIEGIHYYVNDEGYVVLTAQYLLERGYCCGNGCLHCPYNYENVPEPRRTDLLLKKQEIRS
ncbi:MAG: hypothetical protein E6H09_19780 [Bacteroidetes bacterium]|jgi:hypothetical protein|nr:MAG: hypothetical protein E6H09_19780 [Bacteroidota bacterium]